MSFAGQNEATENMFSEEDEDAALGANAAPLPALEKPPKVAKFPVPVKKTRPRSNPWSGAPLEGSYRESEEGKLSMDDESDSRHVNFVLIKVLIFSTISLKYDRFCSLYTKNHLINFYFILV